MPDNIEVFLKEVDKLLDNFADRIFELSQDNLIRQGKVDTGTLLKSGNVNKEFLEKTITYSAPYADIIEYGRNPGQIPYSKWLHKWVRRKLGIRNEAEIKRVAFAIAKSIEQRGIMPSPYIRPAFEKARTEFKV